MGPLAINHCSTITYRAANRHPLCPDSASMSMFELMYFIFSSYCVFLLLGLFVQNFDTFCLLGAKFIGLHNAGKSHNVRFLILFLV